MEMTDFHKIFYELLTLFAKCKIRKLMISVPPQHGKSLGTSTLLPGFMLGRDPSLRICIGSYSFALARRFGLSVQRLIGTKEYADVFPKTFLKGMRQTERAAETALRTADEFDVVGADGGVRLVGRECSLTGNRVDVMILDDIYKDAAEANSPIIREAAWEWYTSVVRTRMHNDSQEIVVFTRWHEDDLIGRIARSEQVCDVTSLAQAQSVGQDAWVRVNFEAIKTGEPTEIDARTKGQVLWSARHSLQLLEQKRALDAAVFEALYQGNPTSKEGLLYGEFQTYDSLPDTRVVNYTDTADMGDDKLCSICYTTAADGAIYIVDVVYSAEPMEVTEVAVADMLEAHGTRLALVESNSGGRGFARALQRHVPGCSVQYFHQTANKESRILTNSATVSGRVRMPQDWKKRWSDFAADLMSFKRVFKANRHDDAADALTGIVEMEYGKVSRKIHAIKFG